MFIKYMLNIS